MCLFVFVKAFIRWARNNNFVHRLVQCALWGYPTEGAYYRDASSIDSLLSIKIPFLAINAEDDPVSRVQRVSVF
jgi:predicted alpha/beta-fold hydrolase